MSAPRNIIGEIKTLRGAPVFMGNLIAALGLLVIGYPVAPAAIRTLLLGWIVVALGLAQLVLGRLFQARVSVVPVRGAPLRSRDCGRYR